MKNKFKITDESGDRRYFTIIPNYIVNHSTPYEQAIYLFMKRKAGENGTCWSSANEIAKRLGISRNTTAKYRNKLLERGWIELIGKKPTGATKQLVDEYKIVDLWKFNNDFYNKEKVSNNESFQLVTGKVSTNDEKVSTVGHKEEPIKEPIKEEPNNIKEIINYFFFLKGWENKTKNFYKQKDIVYGRYAKAAKELLKLCENNLDLTKEKLILIKNWAENKNLDWGIETAIKRWFEKKSGQEEAVRVNNGIKERFVEGQGWISVAAKTAK